VLLVTLLGGEPRPIAAYASLRSMNPDTAAADAQEAVEQDFTATKVKVGGADLAADLRTIHTLRSALGDQPAQVQNGHVVIPERPGNGIEWDETVIKRVTG